MAIKFASILAALGVRSASEPVTEAHLEAADAKIAQLESDKETAEAGLKTALEEKGKVEATLTETKGKLATLEKWKKEQKAVDGRDEDESNSLDDQPEALESWERAAASTIANTKKRLGQK